MQFISMHAINLLTTYIFH